MYGTVVRQLVEIDFAELVQTAAQTGQLFERGDALCKLFSAGQADTAAQQFQPFVGVDAHKAVKREGTGLAVGQVVILAQRVAAGMAYIIPFSFFKAVL